MLTLIIINEFENDDNNAFKDSPFNQGNSSPKPKNNQQQVIIPSATQAVVPQANKKRGEELMVDIDKFVPPSFVSLLSYQPAPFQQSDMFQGCSLRPDNMPQCFGYYEPKFNSFWQYNQMLNNNQTQSIIETSETFLKDDTRKYTFEGIFVSNENILLHIYIYENHLQLYIYHFLYHNMLL